MKSQRPIVPQMNTEPQPRQATVADLYSIRDKAELVDGNIVKMPPTGGRPADAAFAIAISLHQHALATGIGKAIPDNTGFLVDLPNRRSFSPDVAFWIGAAPTMKFYEGAPIFAVEVRSESDYGTAAELSMAQKRQDYFAAGTLVVWDVDLQDPEVITAYSANKYSAVRRFRQEEIADAEPAVPGWRFEVSVPS